MNANVNVLLVNKCLLVDAEVEKRKILIHLIL
jgi:hypothetical protein